MKNLYVIAGPNGAGKTTFARQFLPRFAHCEEFVNADLIATGLSPFDPSNAAIQAGRLVIQRIRELSAKGSDFGFETTLSGRSYLSLLRELKKSGYKISLFFLWLSDVELAIKRVKDRVQQGGHHVPEEDIRRRFLRGLRNLLGDYMPLLDEWTIYDNSETRLRKVAYGAQHKIYVIDEVSFTNIKRGAYV